MSVVLNVESLSDQLNRELGIISHQDPDGLIKMHDLLTWAVGELERIRLGLSGLGGDA